MFFASEASSRLAVELDGQRICIAPSHCEIGSSAQRLVSEKADSNCKPATTKPTTTGGLRMGLFLLSGFGEDFALAYLAAA